MKKFIETGDRIQRKHSRTGHFICCLMMLAVVFLTACGDNVSNELDISSENILNNGTIPGEAASANAAATNPEWVYVPERIEIADQKTDYENMQLMGDTACYISMNGETEGEAQNICRYSLTDRELVSIPIDWKDGGSVREICCYTFDEECNVWLIANVYSADYSQFRRFLYQFDADGKNIFYKEITEQLGGGISLNRMFVDSQKQIYVFSDEYSEKKGIWMYTDNGDYHSSISYDPSEIIQVKGVAEGKNSRIYACISKEKDADHCILAEVNFEGGQLTESITDFPAANGFCADPAAQYDFLIYDENTAYGYDLSSQKQEELFSWGDSDVNGYYVKHLGMSGENVYFCTVADWANDDKSIVLLTKTKFEEAPKRTELALATVDGESGLTALAVGFNRNNDQYHITVKKYESLTDLYNAILAKEAIDIIDLSEVNIENLSRQGIFEDLGTWLDQSETFSRSDFLDGILDAYTINGALVGIPDSFWLQTVVGNASMTENGGLTLEGLLATAESNPGAIPLGDTTRDEMMQYLMIFNEDTFINWETGECHFDSASFKAVLELCSCFPESSVDNKQGNSIIDGKSLPSRIQNGDVLFAIADMTMPKSFQLYNGIFGENAACVGFPTTDGKGGTLLFGDNAFGIVSSSENKSGAWNFVESVLEHRNTDDMDNEEIWHAFYSFELWQYPTEKKAMNAIIDYVMDGDKNGRFSTLFYEDGWNFQQHALAWDEINTILDLIPDATPYFSVEDNPVMQIINEEAGAYYSGQKNADDTVSIIQNRVQLYVNENKSAYH